MNKYLIDWLQVGKDKHPSDVQENINAHLNKIMKIIKDSETKFNKEIEILKRKQDAMKTELRKLIIPTSSLSGKFYK